MEHQIVAAIIGGIAVIIAAIITVVFQANKKQKKNDGIITIKNIKKSKIGKISVKGNVSIEDIEDSEIIDSELHEK